MYLIALLYLQFGSLEEFQEEFKDINQEEQISRLHRMLAPHLLRSTYPTNYFRIIDKVNSFMMLTLVYCILQGSRKT